MTITKKFLKNMINDDGLTLKKFEKIQYKSGYQVATEGIETADEREAVNAIKSYGGNCGIWKHDGIYYIDKSRRISTKKEALEVGRKHNQISILQWTSMKLVYC